MGCTCSIERDAVDSRRCRGTGVVVKRLLNDRRGNRNSCIIRGSSRLVVVVRDQMLNCVPLHGVAGGEGAERTAPRPGSPVVIIKRSLDSFAPSFVSVASLASLTSLLDSLASLPTDFARYRLLFIIRFANSCELGIGGGKNVDDGDGNGDADEGVSAANVSRGWPDSVAGKYNT